MKLSHFYFILFFQSEGGLPHYRSLIPQGRRGALPRIRSDPNMIKVNRPNSNYQHDEPGVHGGEYSVRPNMEESMTFLRKLFTHQQEGGSTLPTLLAPPDSPLRKEQSFSRV